MFIYVENSRRSPKYVASIDKVVRYKAKIENLMVYLYKSNQNSRIKLKWNIYNTIKNMKHSGINLTKIYTESYKS